MRIPFVTLGAMVATLRAFPVAPAIVGAGTAGRTAAGLAAQARAAR